MIHLQTEGDQNHSLMADDHKLIDMTDLILFVSKEYSPEIHSRELILKRRSIRVLFILSKNMDDLSIQSTHAWPGKCTLETHKISNEQ